MPERRSTMLGEVRSGVISIVIEALVVVAAIALAAVAAAVALAIT